MSKCTRITTIIVALLLLFSISAVARDGRLSRQHSQIEQGPVPDPLEGKSVLVHAFLVKIPNEILHETGAAALPLKKSQSVTVEKLVESLEKSKDATVIDTVRVTLMNRQHVETSSKNTNYVTRTVTTMKGDKKVESKRYDSYQAGTSFSVRLNAESDKRAILNINYDNSMPQIDNKADSQAPVSSSGYSSVTRLDIPFAKPVIASSSQFESNSTFLVVLAEVIE